MSIPAYRPYHQTQHTLMNPEQNNERPEERLETIETKIAYQEDLIEELNKTVYQQQQKLERLEATCKSLAQHVASLYESASDGSKPENEKPPHY